MNPNMKTIPSFHTTTCKGLFVLAAFLSLATARAQSVRVQATADHKAILIGERFTLELEAAIPESAPIRFFTIDTIDHFEILGRDKPDTLNTPEGTLLRQRLSLTSFDSGRWVIPAFALVEGEGPFTDSLEIEVRYSEMDTSQPYHDVKDVLDEEAPVEKKISWRIFLIAGLALAALVFLLIVLLRKKRKPSVRPVVMENFYERTLQDLEKAQHSGLPDKAYYSLVTDLFRGYLHQRLGVDAEEKTTLDLMPVLRSLSLPDKLIGLLKEQWLKGDLVKFARGEASPEDRRQMAALVKEALQILEQEKIKSEKNAGMA